jgi:hypothetical protein
MSEEYTRFEDGETEWEGEDFEILYAASPALRTYVDHKGTSGVVYCQPACLTYDGHLGVGYLDLDGEGATTDKSILIFRYAPKPFNLPALYWAMQIIDLLPSFSLAHVAAAYSWASSSPMVEISQSKIIREVGVSKLKAITGRLPGDMLDLALGLIHDGYEIDVRSLQLLIDQGRIAWDPGAATYGLQAPLERVDLLLKVERFFLRYGWIPVKHFEYFDREIPVGFMDELRREVMEGMTLGFGGSVLMAAALFRCLFREVEQVFNEQVVEGDEAAHEVLKMERRNQLVASKWVLSAILLEPQSFSFHLPSAIAVRTYFDPRGSMPWKEHRGTPNLTMRYVCSVLCYMLMAWAGEKGAPLPPTMEYT